ncbi:hypothetical protein [Streptomyces sp. NRRL B-1140]|uniref:hypothetical protein n=1 Tax=Streptomyces sp. NRRL B-1140 TaxID=1415549 RepID=UPI000B2CC0A7|nr:hypothetical protein [Streptomyces sp. NRRL B-1140]
MQCSSGPTVVLEPAEQEPVAGSSTARAARAAAGRAPPGRDGLLLVQHPCAAWPMQMLRCTQETALL